MPDTIIATTDQLDALPVGSVVMSLWDIGPLHYVFQRHSDGWFGFPSMSPLFPLGSARQGETCQLLWRPDT